MSIVQQIKNLFSSPKKTDDDQLKKTEQQKTIEQKKTIEQQNNKPILELNNISKINEQGQNDSDSKILLDKQIIDGVLNKPHDVSLGSSYLNSDEDQVQEQDQEQNLSNQEIQNVSINEDEDGHKNVPNFFTQDLNNKQQIINTSFKQDTKSKNNQFQYKQFSDKPNEKINKKIQINDIDVLDYMYENSSQNQKNGLNKSFSKKPNSLSNELISFNPLFDNYPLNNKNTSLHHETQFKKNPDNLTNSYDNFVPYPSSHHKSQLKNQPINSSNTYDNIKSPLLQFLDSIDNTTYNNINYDDIYKFYKLIQENYRIVYTGYNPINLSGISLRIRNFINECEKKYLNYNQMDLKIKLKKSLEDLYSVSNTIQKNKLVEYKILYFTTLQHNNIQMPIKNDLNKDISQKKLVNTPFISNNGINNKPLFEFYDNFNMLELYIPYENIKDITEYYIIKQAILLFYIFLKYNDKFENYINENDKKLMVAFYNNFKNNNQNQINKIDDIQIDKPIFK